MELQKVPTIYALTTLFQSPLARLVACPSALPLRWLPRKAPSTLAASTSVHRA